MEVEEIEFGKQRLCNTTERTRTHRNEKQASFHGGMYTSQLLGGAF